MTTEASTATDVIADAYAEFLHQEGARERWLDFADWLTGALREAGYVIRSVSLAPLAGTQVTVDPADLELLALNAGGRGEIGKAASRVLGAVVQVREVTP